MQRTLMSEKEREREREEEAALIPGLAQLPPSPRWLCGFFSYEVRCVDQSLGDSSSHL